MPSLALESLDFTKKGNLKNIFGTDYINYNSNHECHDNSLMGPPLHKIKGIFFNKNAILSKQRTVLYIGCI